MVLDESLGDLVCFRTRLFPGNVSTHGIDIWAHLLEVGRGYLLLLHSAIHFT
jgi:hypothetical protein